MYALAVHGGVGGMLRAQLTAAGEQDYRRALAEALYAGQHLLEGGGTALDAVEAAVVALEDHPLFNAGRGAALTVDGTAELDAAIMDGSDLRAGAVAQIRRVRNPVQLARRILEHSAHVFLVGEGAENYAAEAGLALVPNEYFITTHRRQQLATLKQQLARSDPPRSPAQGQAPPASLDEPPFGTVGAVARDAAGALAAATSTGGISGKRCGRIGDSPVIGAGTYADNHTCAVSTTGHGEWLLRLVQAFDIAARLRYGGSSLNAAVDEAMQRLTQLGASGGLIAMNQRGEIAMRFNTQAMFRASVRSDEAASIQIF